MTYFVSLKITAIIVGLLVALAHLPFALSPERWTPTLRSLPRNYPLGVVLMLAATVWFTTLTGVMDLGEISSIRGQLMAVWAISGVLLTIFVPGFLAPRGLGCLLLLASALILDACFLAETPWRYVLTVLAYVWVIIGMFLVYSPHYGRDAIQFLTQSPQRLRLFAWPGVVYGALIIVLGIFVYQS
ncbi:MAG TPA: hypothetical protein VHY09_07145 [Candidatus Methylacidiphilales bacterium]|nr:hypothetical protein [Candidatus Methylacidiphilales bacterium]